MYETASQRCFAELIRQCLLPTKPGQRRPLPIVVLWGPGQSGKSELLDHVHQRFYRGRPAVRRRGDEIGGNRRPYEVALQLAYHLGRRVERFGRVKFPRLFLGITAIRGPVGEPAKDREEMIRRTIPDRQRLTQWMRETSAILLGVVAAERLTRVFAGLVLEGVLATLETAPLLRGRGLRWYRDGLGQHFADPMEALVELAAQEAAGRRAWVDDVLCRAFLADLRDECSNRFLQLYDRNEHCLVVLDDADSPGVHTFFDILGAQREQEWDPLLIVAASSRRFSTAEGQHPEEWPVRCADQARYTDWLENQNENPGWAALYPVTLGGLAEAEATTCFAPRVADKAARQRRGGIDIDVEGVLGSTENAVGFARELTCGHLGGLRLVLRAMTSERTRAKNGNLDLRRLLDWPVTDDEVPLAEVILRQVLGTWSAKLRRVLLCGSAARDLGDIALARVLHFEPAPVRQLMRDFRSRDMWVRHPAAMGRTGPPALHPFARRAALHRLANPRGPGEPTWNEVHKRLHQLAVENGDTTSAMYHRLALGRVGEVSETLSRLFGEQDAPAWFDTLLTITQAPLENPTGQKDAESHCQRLADEAGGGHVVSARLVSALQLHSDPLADPHRDLCRVVAFELEALADHAPEGALVFLLKRADEFHRCHHGVHS